MKASDDAVGVWLVGALGGLATTAMVGARLCARGLVSKTGLLTETDEFAGLGLVAIDQLRFGGHEVREGDLLESARTIAAENGTIDREKLGLIAPDLDEINSRIRMGVSRRSGAAITGFASATSQKERSARDIIAAILADLEAFRVAAGVTRVIVVNVASTEPKGIEAEEVLTEAALEALIDRDPLTLRPSLLYAYAAVQGGCAYLNFTPNTAPLAPGLIALAERRKVPVMGNDGKTGETLVKSALAPMFRDRMLQVLSWQGYNILGDRDGQVLSDPSNKSAKLESKDSVLPRILGYPLHTHVGIDYVPSLGDLKTAWDFIHFQGFLDFKMSMQFTWSGCDAILAAPLVLDMVRLLALALARGEGGLTPWLAPFFKSPVSVLEQDFHRQMAMLRSYTAKVRDEGGAPKP